MVIFPPFDDLVAAVDAVEADDAAVDAAVEAAVDAPDASVDAVLLPHPVINVLKAIAVVSAKAVNLFILFIIALLLF